MHILQFVASSILFQMKLMKVKSNVKKQNMHKCVTDDEIIIVVNPEE
jgi:hypothetical protein